MKTTKKLWTFTIKTLAQHFPDASPQLIDEMREYIEQRKRTTETAVKRLVPRLHTLSDGNQEKAIRILSQSIEGNWTGIFPLRDDKILQPEIKTVRF